MNGLEKYLNSQIKKRIETGAFRKLPINKDLVDFCSNDYLGFARSEELKKNIKKNYNEFPFANGSTGSRLISGNSAYVEQIEKQIAQFHHAEAALLFNSGYDANIGLFSCLVSRQDTIIYDELIHASMRDGIRLSNAMNFSFRHNDVKDLNKKLQKAKGRKIIALESVYSMDGDETPLLKILEIAEQNDASIILDEAHGLGVVGDKGEGLSKSLGLENQLFARIYTFGKAMGAHGAVVVGSSILRDYLINFARSFIYTTALPPHSLVNIEEAYKLLEKTNAVRQLQENIQYFKSNLLPEIRNHFLPSNSAIQCLIISDSTIVKQVADEIQAAGFFAKAILHPTVAKGNERIRFCIHAFNTKKEIERLTSFLNKKYHKL